jgi:hypothetical protein
MPARQTFVNASNAVLEQMPNYWWPLHVARSDRNDCDEAHRESRFPQVPARILGRLPAKASAKLERKLTNAPANRTTLPRQVFSLRKAVDTCNGGQQTVADKANKIDAAQYSATGDSTTGVLPKFANLQMPALRTRLRRKCD